MDLKASPVKRADIWQLTDQKTAQNQSLVDETRPKRREDLNYRTIDGQTLILNREKGQLHQLNPTASFIWDCCDGNSKLAEIVDRLAGTYDVDPSTARKDVEDVLSNLRSSNLLEES